MFHTEPGDTHFTDLTDCAHGLHAPCPCGRPLDSGSPNIPTAYQPWPLPTLTMGLAIPAEIMAT